MKRYFVDLRLRQFREIEDPQNWPDFDGEQNRRMCRQSGIMTCPASGLSVIIPTARKDDDLRCMACFSRIPRFRGHIQANALHRFDRSAGQPGTTPTGAAVVFSAGCLALAHVIVQGRPTAALTFLPGLLLKRSRRRRPPRFARNLGVRGHLRKVFADGGTITAPCMGWYGLGARTPDLAFGEPSQQVRQQQ